MSFPVEVAPVEVRAVEYAVTAVGGVEAFEEVQVTARVAGVVEKLAFTEGDAVRDGQSLLEIDPDRFRLAVESAATAVARAEIVATDAQATLSRREEALKRQPGMHTEEELQIMRTRAAAAAADVAAARTQLKLAELNLRDAVVRAPLAGIIQSRRVQTGQYVQPGVVLATLMRKEPLLVRFDVTETDAARLSPGMALTFQARGQPRAFTGRITHVAAAANVTTRMVPVTARVDDPERALLRPGGFAQVRVPVPGGTEHPTVPQTAVRPSERGFLAYVVENDQTARERVLQLGMRTTDGQVEVKDGLKAGDVLVIRGAEALREGAAVKVVRPGESPGGRGKETPIIKAGTEGDAGPAGRAL